MRPIAAVVLSLVLQSSYARADQQPFSAISTPSDSLGLSDTLVSILSDSTEHTTFLQLLQRSKCIPMLAHINTSTVFAPTDKAWSEWASRNNPNDETLSMDWLGPGGLDEWRLSEAEVLALRLETGGHIEDEQRRLDNQNWALRQHLLYHMLNYTLSPSSFMATNASSNITTLTTLLFPLEKEPGHPRIPEPGPPWLPRGGDGMLGGHGQRLRLARAGSVEGGYRGAVGGDWKGIGGIDIWSGEGWDHGNMTAQGKKSDVEGVRWGANGAVVGIEGVLDTPPSIEEIIRTHPSLSYLARLLPKGYDLPSPLPRNLTTTPHLTVFAPTDRAFDQFDDVEKRYLETGNGIEGLGRIISGGVIMRLSKQQVGWRDYWSNKGNAVQAVSGEQVEVQLRPNGGLEINSTAADTVDMFASNGVVHIVPSLLVPENFTLLNTAEKVLLSLNASYFVSLLRSANLSSKYIGEPSKDAEHAWTILALPDSVLRGDTGDYGNLPPGMNLADGYADATPIAGLLQYHILPGRLMPGDIKDGMLIGTELRTSALGGARQHLQVQLADRFDKSKPTEIDDGELRFGNAAVIGSPVESGNSIIYMLDSMLSPPDDVLQTAVADLQLSTFIAAVYAADLERAVKKNPATTYFIPRNRAFGALGLTMKYLLAPESKDELRKVIKYHAISKIVYSSDIEAGRETYTTLHGGDIVLSKGENGSVVLQSPNKWPDYDSGDAVPANGDIRPARVTEDNALTSTGVIHIIDSVIMPADVKITIGKLIQGSKQTKMADLMRRAGLGWVLDGREPNSDELQRTQLSGIIRAWDNDTRPDVDSLALPGYTVLCPTDKAFSRINLTDILSREDDLVKLLKLHIIPTQPSVPKTGTAKTPAPPPRDGTPISLADDLIYETLLSTASRYGDVAFRGTGDNSFLVGIRNARSGSENSAARIGQTGRASVRWRKSSQAILLDKPKKHKQLQRPENDVLWRGGMTLGGGVMIIDSVLLPYEPTWFSQWGWLVLTLSGIGLLLILGIMSVGWWWLSRRKEQELYEPLEGEDEE